MTRLITKLTTSGNSRAIRLSKAVLEMSKLGEVVELEVAEGQIIIRASKLARAGWAEAIDHDISENGPYDVVDDWGDLRAQGEATIGEGLPEW